MVMIPVPVRYRPVRWVRRRPAPSHPPQRVVLTVSKDATSADQNINNASSYDTSVGSDITPSANKFQTVSVRGHHTTAGTPTLAVTSNAGLNLTWSSIVTVAWNTIAAPTEGLYIHGALTGTTPGSGSVHFAFSGTGSTQSGIIIEHNTWGGCDISGGTVASVIQQTGTGSSDTAGTTWTITFGAAVNTNNGALTAGGNANKNAPNGTVNDGFTGSANRGSTESTAYNLGTDYVLSGFTGTTHTRSSTTASAVWGICGVELKVAPSFDPATMAAMQHRDARVADPIEIIPGGMTPPDFPSP